MATLATLVSGVAITEYYLIPRSISSLLSRLVCRQQQMQAIRLNQTVDPETVTKTHILKEDVARFSEVDSDSLTVTINIENISNIQLENLKLQYYGLKGFQFCSALLGSPDMTEEKYSTIFPSSESEDKVEFGLPNLPYGKKDILKLMYAPKQDATNSDTIVELTAQLYDEGWPIIPKPLDLCEGYRRVASSFSIPLRVKNVIRQLFDLRLYLFHDFHGDDAKQEDEPVITDAELDVYEMKSLDYTQKVLEGIKGNGNKIYKLDDLVEGKEYLFRFSDDTKRKFRYISISNEEFKGIDEYKFIANSEKSEVSLGLMVGPFTLPLLKGTKWYWGSTSFVDHGGLKDWKGGRQSHLNHRGTDFYIPANTPVVAAAPGKVIWAEDGWPNNPNYDIPYAGNELAIDHGYGLRTLYCHLNKLLVKERPFDPSYGEKVNRGQIIALSGDTGDRSTIGAPHLHFEVMNASYTGIWGNVLDPYRILWDKYSYSLWTKDNDPQYPINYS